MDAGSNGPARVSGYEVVGTVAHGGTAVVLKARDVGLQRDVALKRVPPESVDALRREAARLALLDDPHVVAVHGLVEEPDAAYLVLEWVDGATVAEVLAAGAELSTAQALGVCRGALLGLAHAHGRGVVHGDVSASNVLVDTGGTSRLVDFGVGGSTPAYRSPEAAAGEALTPAADVYAAAALLVHLLTGAAAPDAAPDLGAVDPGIRPVLARALAAAPADRQPDAATLLAELEEEAERTYGAAWWTTAGVGVLVAPAVATLVPIGGGATAGTVVGAVAGAGAVAAGRPRVSRKVAIGAGAAALLVLVGGLTAVALVGSGPDEVASSAAGPGADAGADGDDAEAEEVVEEVDPVVASAPSGKYTLRQVVTSTTWDGYQPVGPLGEGIWTLDLDCETAVACGGTIESSSGRTYPFTWTGGALVQELSGKPTTYDAECVDSVTNEVTGPVVLEERSIPAVMRRFRPVGPTDPETGLADTYVATSRSSLTVVSYENLTGGPGGPEECPFGDTEKIRAVIEIEATLTRGADPDVVKAERKRIAKEKRQKKAG
ncbi:serine/threonine-protein kinase [Nocardioides sp. YIM 152588]|uniref:serine/threonine-protein kinase n=1 Tax=Nocardioides sp. YIM 152588 TaxID=3158259 RepID=UPI0032E37EF0